MARSQTRGALSNSPAPVAVRHGWAQSQTPKLPRNSIPKQTVAQASCSTPLASETWPLLEDSSPITKADRAQMLGDPAEN